MKIENTTTEDELLNAWKLCNGGPRESDIFTRPGYLTGYDFLSIEQSLKERLMMKSANDSYKGYEQEYKRDTRISENWFEEGWVPFGKLGGGSLLLIVDYSPALREKIGQIIGYIHDPDEILYILTRH